MKRGAGILPDMERLRVAVQKRLTPHRYAHSIAVRKQAMALAAHFGEDWYRAGVAGLIHDACKCMERDAQLNYLGACGILLDDLTLAHPQIWHALAGAEYARRELGVEDEEIISAVRYHTTGRAAMTPLEKILYVADHTSPDRCFPDAGFVRYLAERSLDESVRYCQRYIVGRLIGEGKPVVREAWEAYNYYVMLDTDDENKERE